MEATELKIDVIIHLPKLKFSDGDEIYFKKLVKEVIEKKGVDGLISALERYLNY